MTRILSILMALVLSFGFSPDKVKATPDTPMSRAGEVIIDGLHYTKYDDNQYQLVSCDDDVTDVVIPSTIEVDGSFYTVASVASEVFKEKSSLVSVVWPKTVTSIPNNCFMRSSLSKIDLPSTLLNIGSNAFSGCVNLTSITLPESLNVISGAAFSSCTSLKAISIPSSVNSMGSDAIYGCSLERLIFEDGKNPIQLDPQLVEKIDNLYLGRTVTGPFNDVRIGSVSFGPSVKEIRAHSFNSCNIKSLIIPTTVYAIYAEAFYQSTIFELTIEACGAALMLQVDDITTPIFFEETEVSVLDLGRNLILPQQSVYIDRGLFGLSLTQINLNEGITKIPEKAFFNCKNINKVSFPSSLRNIGNGAFDGCSSLSEITLPSGIEVIGNSAFHGTGISSITIPSSIKEIGGSAFWNCKNLENVIFEDGESPIQIGDGGSSESEAKIFLYSDGDKGLKTAYLGRPLYGFGSDVFSHQPKLESVTLGPYITEIKGNLFSDCVQLAEISIPSTVTKIESFAFAGSGLIKISIPSSVTELGQLSFIGCNQLREVVLEDGNSPLSINMLQGDEPDFYLSIGNPESVYWGRNVSESIILSASESLKDVIIGPMVTILPDRFLKGCQGVTELTIPYGVTYIGQEAFEDTRIKSLIIPSSVKQIGSSAFRCNEALELVELSDNLISIPEYLFAECSSIKHLTIPRNVNRIEGGALLSCSSLESIDMPNGLNYLGRNVFRGCNSLKQIALPDGVTVINEASFNGCNSLSSMRRSFYTPTFY